MFLPLLCSSFFFCFFFLRLPHPPISTRTDTLFPSTPLFRSLRRQEILSARRRPPFHSVRKNGSAQRTKRRRTRRHRQYFGIPQRAHLVQECAERSEEHTSELQSLMRISYAVFCLKKKKITHKKRELQKKSNKTKTQ